MSSPFSLTGTDTLMAMGICREYFFLGWDLLSKSKDNIIITDDVAEADKFVAKWKALSEAGPF